MNGRRTVLAAGTAVAFSVYPILYFLAANRDRMYAVDAVRPLAIAVAIGLTAFGVSWLVLRDSRKAALFVPAVVLMVFLQKPVSKALSAANLGGRGIVLIILVSLLLLGVLALVLWRTKYDLTPWLHTAALIALALILLPLASIVRFELANMARSSVGSSIETTVTMAVRSRAPHRKPDIYYIVLDAYGRDDVLRSLYGYDNTALLEALEERGFFVARQSRSNYSWTTLSLCSSLNSMYLDDVTTPIRASQSQLLLDDMIKDNAVARVLRGKGYRYVAIGSGWRMSSPNRFADVDLLTDWSTRNRFEQMVLDQTLVPKVLRLRSDGAPIEHRQHVLRQFEALGSVADLQGPKFVFCHLVCPHQPFIFDVNGEFPVQERTWSHDEFEDPATREIYMRGYVTQLPTLNARLLDAVDAILAHYDPANRPVIVIQGDHGPQAGLDLESFEETDLYERMSILNAIYVPPDVPCAFDDSITPVNTFRIVLNGLLDTRLEILPNRHFFSSWPRPYRLIPIPEERMLPKASRDRAHSASQ
jgi:hypothetical protein